MKKIFSIIIAACFLQITNAQTSGAVMSTSPSQFTAEDRVKVTVNVSNVPNLRGKEPLYIWTWDPGDPAPGNGAWDNSSEGRKMTKEGADIWSWTFKPTEFYGKAPAEITQIQFLVKAKSGNGDAKSDDLKLTVAPLVYVPTVFSSFPRFISHNEFIIFYLDQNLATDLTTQRMNPQQAKVSLYDAAGIIIDAEKTVALSDMGNKTFTFSIYPPKIFNIPAGKTAVKIRVVYTGTLLDANGATQNVSSPGFEKGLDNLK